MSTVNDWTPTDRVIARLYVEEIWTAARDRWGVPQDHRYPHPAARAALLHLAVNEVGYCGEIARAADIAQSAVLRALRRLEDFRFIELADTRPVTSGTRVSGGRPASWWQLTANGWDLVAALRAELRHEAVTS